MTENKMNYKARYQVSDLAFDDRSKAVEAASLLDIKVRDNAGQRSSSARVKAYGQGYYDLGFKGTTLEELDHYMDGFIAVRADRANDRLDDLLVQKELEHEAAIHARGGDTLLSRLLLDTAHTVPVVYA